MNNHNHLKRYHSGNPFSIHLSSSGEPEALLIASRDDWPGRAVIFARNSTDKLKSLKEYQQVGFYILVSSKLMYIGVHDPSNEQLDAHKNNKKFWCRGIFFTSEVGSLSRALVQHLTSRLISKAKLVNSVGLDKAIQPALPELSEEDDARMENFLHEVLRMLPMLGFRQFFLEQD